MTPVIIYCATHSSGKKYVGQTRRSLKTRWAQHVRDSRSPVALTNPFHAAIQQYGAHTFTVEILEIALSPWDGNKAESKWIQKLGTLTHGYNVQP